MFFISFLRFKSVYLDDDIRIAKDILGDYLVVDRAPYEWTE
ncbi:plastid-lipid associated protein PAP [Actinidia rufa]|uniref:Plastid-lipid associated protein PAP n=1 Tax=Actinidia rufa TaxID=165716 RepID=A0A7J0E3R0_9ERIC|nr:plastid-lipid associated protein PAP [Actinidia rufa]